MSDQPAIDAVIIVCEAVVVVGLEVAGQPALHLGMNLRIGGSLVQLPVLFVGTAAAELQKQVNQSAAAIHAGGN